MSTLEEQIDVGAPAQVAWECLHRVETFPEFVQGVRQARLHGAHLAQLEIDTEGRTRSFDTEITDRGKDQLMIWRTRGEPQLSVTFSVLPLDPDRTRVQVRLTYDPGKLRDTFGGPKGFAQVNAIERAVRSDLEHFRDVVERESRQH